MPLDFSVEGKVSGLMTMHPILTLNFSSTWCGVVTLSIRLHFTNTISCAHRFFFDSFISSDGSEVTTVDCVVSPRSIMMHQGFRSKEVRCARKQTIYYYKQDHTLHCRLLANVMYSANSTKRFFCLIRSNPIFCC